MNLWNGVPPRFAIELQVSLIDQYRTLESRLAPKRFFLRNLNSIVY